MKKLTQIIATAFLSLSLNYSTPILAKDVEFNLRQAEEVTTDTKIDLEGVIPWREDLIEKEKGYYLENDMERKFYGLTSNKEIFIELMIFKKKEKKIGEEDNYAYMSFWGNVGKGGYFEPGNKYRVEDTVLAVSSNLDEFKKDLEKVDSPLNDSICLKGIGRSFTIYGEESAGEDNKDDNFLYFGLKLRNLETDKIEYLVYAVELLGVDDKENPSFKGHANGLISYQDTDNDSVDSIIVKQNFEQKEK